MELVRVFLTYVEELVWFLEQREFILMEKERGELLSTMTRHPGETLGMEKDSVQEEERTTSRDILVLCCSLFVIRELDV